MPKLLIIDKSVFHKSVIHKNFTDQLIKFVQSHLVVLPHALVVECIISDDEGGSKPVKNPENLLEKVVILIKAGAYIAYSPHEIFRQEKNTKKSIDCIIDNEGTKLIKESEVNLTRDKINRESELAKKAFQPGIDFCKEFATTYYKNIEKRGLQRKWRIWANRNDIENINRLEDWLNAADKKRDEILQRLLSSIRPYVTDSNDLWFSWQLLRVYCAWGIDWAFKRNQSGPSFKGDIENDFYDMEYVACLINADGILTKDENLVIPLAKAAFPEKDVFSCLDEVTEDYRC